MSTPQEKISPYISPERFLVVVDEREVAIRGIDAARKLTKSHSVYEHELKPTPEVASVELEAQVQAA